MVIGFIINAGRSSTVVQSSSAVTDDAWNRDGAVQDAWLVFLTQNTDIIISLIGVYETGGGGGALCPIVHC